MGSDLSVLLRSGGRQGVNKRYNPWFEVREPDAPGYGGDPGKRKHGARWRLAGALGVEVGGVCHLGIRSPQRPGSALFSTGNCLYSWEDIGCG